MSQRNLLIVLLATATSYACYVRGEQNPYARYVASGLSAIDRGVLHPVPDRELFHGAMQGMVEVLRRHGDEHSLFLPEEDADPVRTEIRQQFGGIGVRIGLQGDPPRLTIVGPPEPGTPAARANLLPRDQILAIDGEPTDEMTMTEVLRRMRGRPGTSVRLSIQHEHQGQPRDLELVREMIHIESILGDRRREDGGWEFLLADHPRIAHVRIAPFGDRTAAELDRVMNEVIAAGAEAVVLDLRDNPGGPLDAAVAVCDLFLPAGKTIVETRDRNEQLRQRYTSSGAARYGSIPLAVIVNHQTASASEIVAACLQDHGRAVVVGERTYGKGTVQQLVPLESGRSLLKLTWASFWRPNGANIHHLPGTPDNGTWGVRPDAGFERPLSPDEYAAYRKYRTDRDIDPAATADFIDEPLQMAVDHLQRIRVATK